MLFELTGICLVWKRMKTNYTRYVLCSDNSTLASLMIRAGWIACHGCVSLSTLELMYSNLKMIKTKIFQFGFHENKYTHARHRCGGDDDDDDVDSTELRPTEFNPPCFFSQPSGARLSVSWVLLCVYHWDTFLLWGPMLVPKNSRWRNIAFMSVNGSGHSTFFTHFFSLDMVAKSNHTISTN